MEPCTLTDLESLNAILLRNTGHGPMPQHTTGLLTGTSKNYFAMNPHRFDYA
jgi:hypothetical protein